jgi:hypothetical protein
MAGFLFRKQKQDHNNKSSIVISSPSVLQSPPSTPLYARFSAASPRDTNGGATSPVRKVSLPKPLGLQGRGQRGEKLSNGVEGKYGYSSNSLTSVDRDGPHRNPKVQDVAQKPQLRGEPTVARPASQLLVDKPLPPPVPPAEDKPTILGHTTLAGPPTAFPKHRQSQGRMSLSSDKPLPRPGSSQSFLPTSTPSSASLKTSFSRTRSPSTSTSSVMQGADIQTKIQRQWSTSTSNQKTSNDSTRTESTFPMKAEDSSAGTSQNGPIGETLVPTLSSKSTDFISSIQRTSGNGSSTEPVMDHLEALSLMVSFSYILNVLPVCSNAWITASVDDAYQCQMD